VSTIPTAEEIFKQIFLEEQQQQQQQGEQNQNQHQPRPRNLIRMKFHAIKQMYLRRLEQSAKQVIRQLYAESTISVRRNIWKRYLEFCREQRLDPFKHMDYAITMMVQSTERTTLPSTRQTYVNSLTSIAKRLQIQTPISMMYAGGLRGLGSLLPTEQALPFDFNHLPILKHEALTQLHGPQLHAALYLCLKSCSRWDEVQRLRGSSFVKINEDEIIIDWANNTKMTRSTNPFREDSCISIRNLNGNPPEIIATIRAVGNEEFLISRTTSWMDKWLAKVFPIEKYTCHSFKRGSLTFLAQAIDAKTPKSDGQPLDISVLPNHSEAQNEQSNVADNDTPIHRRSGNKSSPQSVGRSDNSHPMVKDQSFDLSDEANATTFFKHVFSHSAKTFASPKNLVGEHQHSLAVRRNYSKIPLTPAEKALPIQNVSRVTTVNIKFILERANETASNRLQYLLNLLHNPFGNLRRSPIHVRRSNHCNPADCAAFVNYGICKRVSAEDEKLNPSLGWMNGFTVVELGKNRRRFIHDPKEQNASVYANGYAPDIPDLKHSSYFLGSTKLDLGVVNDIHASFYTVPIDSASGKYYRFRDSAGNLYEMAKMVMGFAPSVEIQQIITSIIAGKKGFVKECFEVKCVCDVWVDGIRYCGDSSQLNRAQNTLRQTCKRCERSNGFRTNWYCLRFHRYSF
jgi:hypothetical protein